MVKKKPWVSGEDFPQQTNPLIMGFVKPLLPQLVDLIRRHFFFGSSYRSSTKNDPEKTLDSTQVVGTAMEKIATALAVIECLGEYVDLKKLFKEQIKHFLATKHQRYEKFGVYDAC